MSESNGYATKDALQERRGKRRFKDYQWSDIGRVELQSLMAGEWIKIDTANARMRMAAMAGKKKEHEAAAQDFLLQVCYLTVLDKDHNPFFSLPDKDLILGLDSALTDPLVTAAIEHAGLDEVSVGDAQKNLPTTSGSSSHTG